MGNAEEERSGVVQSKAKEMKGEGRHCKLQQKKGRVGGDNTKPNSYAKGFQDGRMSVIQEAKDIINKDVAGIYSAIFMNLHDRYGFGYERLNRLAEETLQLWDEFPGDPMYIINECERRTGISVLSLPTPVVEETV